MSSGQVQVILIAAGCTGAPSHPATPAHASTAPTAHSALTGAQRRALAARYLAIAKAGNRRLEEEFGALHGRDRHNLAAAHRDLREAAATERLFDQRLMGITFPPQTERIAEFLY